MVSFISNFMEVCLMKKKERVLYLIGSAVASFALMITSLNINTTCMFIAHQPKLPDSAKKLRKF